jgi:PEGA domain
MRKTFVFALLALALACDRTGEQTGPSTIPPSSPAPTPTPTPNPTPTPGPRVVLSGKVYAASSGGVDHYGAGAFISARVFVVSGVNAGRETYSPFPGYKFSDLEPGVMTLHVSSSGYQDQLLIVDVRTDTTLDIGLEPGPWPGFVLSGNITTQWGELINDPGVEAIRDGRVYGGGARPPVGSGVSYRIPTLPAGEYTLRVVKGGYEDPRPTVTVTRDTTLDIVLARVKVLLFGTVREAAPCTGAIEEAEVEIVSGPDIGVGVRSTATGYRTDRRINWGKFRLRATKVGYVPVEVSMDVPYPGSRCFSCPFDAPVEVQQDFVLQRTGGC